MTTTHRVTGQVPPDSPLRALVGRTVSLSATTLAELVARITEMRRGGIAPVVLPARYVPWTSTILALALAGGVLAALITALAAILAGHTGLAWSAAGGMVLLGIALFPILTHQDQEMDR